ncbi:uncharacterized protein LOC110987727 [Acanthaster planci]|uniref:Uncharacterized protein LOC110987727 n=1 Tax=Acanthaster planci TaxID=133434 RepID=A0A8B7ZMY4_ACAPL|nr:uncharacterized protein LOC110987727 [Acanthaster planci]
MDLLLALLMLLCIGGVLGDSVAVDQPKQSKIRRNRTDLEYIEQVVTLNRSRPRRDGGESVKDSLYVSEEHVYIQTRQTHQIPCLSWAGEEVLFTFWFRGEQELARQIPTYVGDSYSLNDRYQLSETHSLIIKNVERSDEGVYECRVVLSKTGVQHEGSVAVTVLDSHFPATDVANKTNLVIERGQSHEIRCPLLLSRPVSSYNIYWSLDIEETNDTSVIGARYSNGDIVVMTDYSGNYIVRDDGTLSINPLKASNSRFWCHLFLKGSGILSECIDVIGKVTSKEHFPAISNCTSDEDCTLNVENEYLRLNCSVENIYPELELSWSLGDCQESNRPIISTKAYSLYNKTSETYSQQEELQMHLPANASIKCTFICNASGLAINNPPVTGKVVVVSDRRFGSDGKDILLAIIPAICVTFVILVIVICVVLVKHRSGAKCRICPEKGIICSCVKGKGMDSNQGKGIDEEVTLLTVKSYNKDNYPRVQNQTEGQANTSAIPDRPVYSYNHTSSAGEGPSSNESGRHVYTREQHKHYTMYNYILKIVSPRKKSHPKKKTAGSHQEQVREIKAASIPLPDDNSDEDECEAGRLLEMQQLSPPACSSAGDEPCVNKKMQREESHTAEYNLLLHENNETNQEIVDKAKSPSKSTMNWRNKSL